MDIYLSYTHLILDISWYIYYKTNPYPGSFWDYFLCRRRPGDPRHWWLGHLGQVSRFTRPGKATKNDGKIHPCYENGDSSSISTGPFSIALCMFTRGYVHGWMETFGKGWIQKNYRRDMTLLRFPVDFPWNKFWDDNFMGFPNMWNRRIYLNRDTRNCWIPMPKLTSGMHPEVL